MKKILFIEDESALQKSMGDVLRKEGYKVLSALNGEIGLRQAITQSPDLILLDLVLPQKDGFEVFRALRKDEKTSGIPVIVLTNLEQMEDVEKALELGAKTYLVKANYTLSEVVEKIKEII